MTFGLRAIGVIIGILLIVSPAFGEAIGAETINIDIVDSYTDSRNVELVGDRNSPYVNFNNLNVISAGELRAPFTLILHTKISIDKTGQYSDYIPIALKSGESICGHGTMGYQLFPNSTGYVWLDIESFNYNGSGSVKFAITTPDGNQSAGKALSLRKYNPDKSSGGMPTALPLAFDGTVYVNQGYIGIYTYNVHKDFRHKITVTYTAEIDKTSIDNIEVARVVDGKPYTSTVEISAKSGVYHQSTSLNAPISINISSLERPYQINTFSPVRELWYNKSVLSGDPTPTDPTPTPTATPQPVMRTGTVTMTDNNGTSISGFEVTAVNHYTGQEYIVSTDTDVAVITLPMDRTIEIRNPQTGEYEEAPVGYYRFFGQAPGYKMLNEDGIKVSVMPEKYGSYQLCDILVTSESGYLTGKHQFQIRSRSDNSILQTGTISAKSSTTNQWYNETVSDGIGTIVLPYDTSNPISQYAGNYYVYATSPGYYDSDYGTQIVVMPHTVSEINTILLTPIGGIPPAGNVTLRLQAFSEYGPGVANASIFIAGVLGAGSDVWNTYTTSSTGYLAVSVPGNSTYDIVASAEGYYDSARRIEVFTEAPGLIEMKLYLSGAPTVEPTTQPTGWVTEPPTTQPTGGIPDEDDDSAGFLMQAVRGIGLAFGVGFATAKLIFGMLLALSIGFATAKQLRGGAAEFGLGLLGGIMLGVLIGLLPVWTVVVLLLIVGLYIGNRYVGGANNG
jgi:hypothetical protein